MYKLKKILIIFFVFWLFINFSSNVFANLDNYKTNIIQKIKWWDKIIKKIDNLLNKLSKEKKILLLERIEDFRIKKSIKSNSKIDLILKYIEEKIKNYNIPEFSTYKTQDKLNLVIKKTTYGVLISSIEKNKENILNTSSKLFNLEIQNLNTKKTKILDSSLWWEKVYINKKQDFYEFILSKPVDNFFPETLKVIVSIKLNWANSDWDLQVIGIWNNHSLITAKYPIFNIKTKAEDNFFVPYYHWKIFKNPVSTKINYTSLYPRWWSATMQYMAYYNNDYWIYFWIHDKKAYIKRFWAETKDNWIEVFENVFVPNKTLVNNDFDFPWTFALNIFYWDWYEASKIYKKWVFTKADYKPVDTKDRLERQQKIWNIALWIQESVESYDMSQLKSHIKEFIDYMDVPTWIAWSSFNWKKFDTLYPEIFPEKKWLKDVISSLKKSFWKNIFFSGYMNGLLYDVSLDSYNKKGLPNTIKDKNKKTILYNKLLSYICPYTDVWHDIMSNTTDKMTKNIGFDTAYVDMVTAAWAKECYDKTHNHTLGWGDYWRKWFKKMFSEMHKSSKSWTPFISEEANDFLADEVDAFLTIGYSTNNMVPALSSVYAWKVQIIWMPMWWSDYKWENTTDSTRFYARLAQSFSFWVQQWRYWMGLVSNKHTRTQKVAQFVKTLAKLRIRLKDFFSFGYMLKPLKLKWYIPKIDFKPYYYPALYQEEVVISGIQTSTWTNSKDILIIFINAFAPDTKKDINFSFEFNAKNYWINDKIIKIKEIIGDSSTNYKDITNTFKKNITLWPASVKAYIISRK